MQGQTTADPHCVSDSRTNLITQPEAWAEFGLNDTQNVRRINRRLLNIPSYPINFIHFPGFRIRCSWRDSLHVLYNHFKTENNSQKCLTPSEPNSSREKNNSLDIFKQTQACKLGWNVFCRAALCIGMYFAYLLCTVNKQPCETQPKSDSYFFWNLYSARLPVCMCCICSCGGNGFTRNREHHLNDFTPGTNKQCAQWPPVDPSPYYLHIWIWVKFTQLQLTVDVILHRMHHDLFS